MNPKAFFDAMERRAQADTSVIATLRRSLAEAPGTYAPAFPLVEPHAGGLHEAARRTLYLAAGLWATGQRRGQGAPTGLVDAVQKVARQRDSKSVEQRFVALLDADADELVWRLRHLVQLVASEGVSIDWPALLADLLAWQHPERRVQQRWARQYWRMPAAHPDAPAHLDAAE